MKAENFRNFGAPPGMQIRPASPTDAGEDAPSAGAWAIAASSLRRRIGGKENTRCNRSSSFSFASSVSISPYSLCGFAACHYEFRARHSDVMSPRNIVATPTRDAPSISRSTRETARANDAESDANWPLGFHHFAHREPRVSREALFNERCEISLMKSLAK